MKEINNKTADFGFQKIPWEEKQKKVDEVFYSVAEKYDIMNDLLSFKMHHVWKKFVVKKAKIKTCDKILDLAGGTGDISSLVSKKIGEKGLVILADINIIMLRIAKKKLMNEGSINVKYVQANAEQLPFEDNFFDNIIISFGLRNIRNKKKALSSMLRVLKPGGKLLVLDFSKPIVPAISYMYNKYSFNLIPYIGEIIAKDIKSYRYLVESIAKHPDQKTLSKIMMDTDFHKVQHYNLTFGIAALHIGYKY